MAMAELTLTGSLFLGFSSFLSSSGLPEHPGLSPMGSASLDLKRFYNQASYISFSYSSGSQPLWGLKDPFTGVTYQIFCVSDIYIMTHNGSKINYKVAAK